MSGSGQRRNLAVSNVHEHIDKMKGRVEPGRPVRSTNSTNAGSCSSAVTMSSTRAGESPAGHHPPRTAPRKRNGSSAASALGTSIRKVRLARSPSSNPEIHKARRNSGLPLILSVQQSARSHGTGDTVGRDKLPSQGRDRRPGVMKMGTRGTVPVRPNALVLSPSFIIRA